MCVFYFFYIFIKSLNGGHLPLFLCPLEEPLLCALQFKWAARDGVGEAVISDQAVGDDDNDDQKPGIGVNYVMF